MRYLPEAQSIRRVFSMRAQMRVSAMHRKGGLWANSSGEQGGKPVPGVLVRRGDLCPERSIGPTPSIYRSD